MDIKNLKKIMPILQAIVDGKTIQHKTINREWYDTNVASLDHLVTYYNDYRIKPEQKFRPFKDAEECWNEMQKHQPFGWVRSKDDGSRALITLMISERDISINSISGLTMYELMEKFTFDDGAVFGILKEE
jgi:hypothetical protein